MHSFYRKGCDNRGAMGVCDGRQLPVTEGTTMNRLLLLPATLLSAEACEASEPGLTYGGSWPEALIVITIVLIAARRLVNWLDRITQFREK